MSRTHFLGLMLLAASLAVTASAADGIAWRRDFDAAKQEAATSGRLVLLHFSGSFCPPCRAMEQTVFNRADVAYAVERDYVPVAVDVEKNPALRQQFGIRPIPADLIVTPAGETVFLELNPSGEWGMLERDLGLPIGAALAEELLRA